MSKATQRDCHQCQRCGQILPKRGEHKCPAKPVGERFASFVDKRAPYECWIWRGKIELNGYGRFWLGGTQLGAHRVAWILSNGEIPDGMEIDHLCEVRSCVNPAHLAAVPHIENMKHGRHKRFGGKVTKPCPTCGKDFTSKKCANQTFCSKSCRRKLTRAA